MQLPTIEELEEKKRRSLIEAHARVQSFVHYWSADRVLGVACVGADSFPLHIDDISQLLHAANAVIAQMNRESSPTAVDWQPIDTAPKDGTRVLLWDGFTWSKGMFEAGEWCCAPDGYPPIVGATHWAIPRTPAAGLKSAQNPGED